MHPPLIRIWIAESAVSAMLLDGRTHFPNETGGVLIGYWASDAEAVIATMIEGGPKAKRTRTRFVPDSEFQNARIEKIYQESNQSLAYLGDWHTHPLGRLALSPTDKTTLRRISSYPDARANTPIMLLLAGGDGDWSMAAWCWRAAWKFWQRPQDCSLLRYDPLQQ